MSNNANITRRTFIAGAAFLAASVPMGSVLAACSERPVEADDVSGGGDTAATSELPADSPSESSRAVSGSVLVACFSATGRTEGVANAIAEELGADSFTVVPAQPYSADDLDWTDGGSRVSLEHEDPDGRHVELEAIVPDGFDSYDVVFVGFPTWWQNASWVMDDFVKGNDFTGKTVIPFTTSSSSPLGDSGTNLAAMAGTGNWLEGMRFSGGTSAGDVVEWVRGLGL